LVVKVSPETAEVVPRGEGMKYRVHRFDIKMTRDQSSDACLDTDFVLSPSAVLRAGFHELRTRLSMLGWCNSGTMNIPRAGLSSTATTGVNGDDQ